MSPLSSYRRLFSLTGPAYVFIAFLGRLPLAMSQLGTLLLVSGVTGSYAAGGASAGALAVANAIGSPIAGALTDRIGQRPVIFVQSVVAAAGLVVLVAQAGQYEPGQAWWPMAALAAVAGLFTPQVGTMARVRWRPISRSRGAESRPVLDAAFSYEGAADEASFVLGPALVGALAALADPQAAILWAAATLAVFGSWFAWHPTARLAVGAKRMAPATLAGVSVAGPLMLLASVQLSIGMVFGSVQTGTSVLATAAGEPGLTGLMHALLGVGSVLAGLAVVALPEAFAYESRLRVFTTVMVVLSLPLLAVHGLLALAGVLIVLGVAIAPSMITTFTLVERIVDMQRLGASMTVLAATTGLGYAIGSSIAGRLADWGGHTPAYSVTVAATVLAATLSWSGARSLRRSQAQRPVTPTAAESSG